MEKSDLFKDLGESLRPETGYSTIVYQIESEAKIEYRKWMKGQGLKPDFVGESAYVHGVLTAKLSVALKEIDSLKRQIK